MRLADAIKSTAELFQSATKKALIYDGHFDPKIYQSGEVIKQIIEAVERDVNIEVICDESAEIHNEEINSLVTDGKILIHRQKLDKGNLKRLYSRSHIEKGHYMVVDGLHTRKEEIHSLGPDKRRALIQWLNLDGAQKLENDFYRRLNS